MPKKVWPTRDEFAFFAKSIQDVLGFEPVSNQALRSALTRLNFPRQRAHIIPIGSEIGFRYEANGLVVYIWTTWDSNLGTIRDEDAGWGLISENGNAQYFSHSVSRTENFFATLFEYADTAQTRVINRPECPQCGLFLNITKGQALKSRYWSCVNLDHHEDRTPYWVRWDVGLSELQAKRVEARRKRRRPYREQRKASGKKNFVALLTRAGKMTTHRQSSV